MVEVDRTDAVDKTAFKEIEVGLRGDLLEAQLELLESKGFAVMIVLAGADGAGKSEVMARLGGWLDQRHVRVGVFGARTQEEQRRPQWWRYWSALAPRGEIGLLLGSWYRDLLEDVSVSGKTRTRRLARDLAEIGRFERMLVDEGVLLIKLWLHVPPGEQKQRLAKIRKLPGGGRHVVEFRLGRKLATRNLAAFEKVVRTTSTDFAPWIVVPSADARYRDVTVGRSILKALRDRLDRAAAPAGQASASALVTSIGSRSVLDRLDLGQRLDRDAYRKMLVHWQRRLADVTDSRRFRKRGAVLVFEGTDAAGKGGSIRRVAQAIDPKLLRVHSIAAPSDEEKAQPYLWRFWRRMPASGDVAIFDRSWYGRVLVERVEEFCSPAHWMRAYDEINDFEAQLARHGLTPMKFWLAISKDEQLRRFQAREQTNYKRYKITAEDWRNREKWEAYRFAINDMVERTSTKAAPWVIVECEDKLFGRIKILKAIVERLEEEI